MSNLYIPETGIIDYRSMDRWYGNIKMELNDSFLEDDEKKYVTEYYSEAGLLQSYRQPFFRRHFIESFAEAADFLLGSSAEGSFLDLGCGTGTQSLFLAIAGARVIGVDMDSSALKIFRKRQAFYEKLLGRKLEIELHEGDVFKIDFGALGPLRGIYSMFAFNIMQPSDLLLDKLVSGFAKGCRFVVIDGNSSSLLVKIAAGRKREVWSPIIFSQNLKARSIQVISHTGGVAIPPPIWKVLPYNFLAGLDRILCKNLILPISHQIMGYLE